MRFQRLGGSCWTSLSCGVEVLFACCCVRLALHDLDQEIRGAALDWATKANKTEQRDNENERGALHGDRVQHS